MAHGAWRRDRMRCRTVLGGSIVLVLGNAVALSRSGLG